MGMAWYVLLRDRIRDGGRCGPAALGCSGAVALAGCRAVRRRGSTTSPRYKRRSASSRGWGPPGSVPPHRSGSTSRCARLAWRARTWRARVPGCRQDEPWPRARSSGAGPLARGRNRAPSSSPPRWCSCSPASNAGPRYVRPRCVPTAPPRSPRPGGDRGSRGRDAGPSWVRAGAGSVLPPGGTSSSTLGHPASWSSSALRARPARGSPMRQYLASLRMQARHCCLPLPGTTLSPQPPAPVAWLSDGTGTRARRPRFASPSGRLPTPETARQGWQRWSASPVASSYRRQAERVPCLAWIRGALPRDADDTLCGAERGNQVLGVAIRPLGSGQGRHDLALPPRVECGAAERPQDECTLAHGGTHQGTDGLCHVALAGIYPTI